jgi:serine/threonine-protein kinase HipA
MITLARARMQPGDVLSLLDLAIFNILACNTDAHAKNYSILIRGRAGVRFAPAYDIMCAEPYEGVTRNLAQTIAGKNRGEHIRRRHWERFFKEAGLGVRASLDRVSKLASAVIDWAPTARGHVAAMPAVEGAMLHECQESVMRRARAVIDGLKDQAGAADEDEGIAESI